MTKSLKDLSFQFSSTGLPMGGSYSCDCKSGTCSLTYNACEDVLASTGRFCWNISLSEKEEQALVDVLFSIMEQAPLSKETAIILDGSPTSLRIDYNGQKTEHQWNSYSDHEIINKFSALISAYSSKPHKKRKLKLSSDLVI